VLPMTWMTLPVVAMKRLSKGGAARRLRATRHERREGER
jgi:hypothetical protein